METRDGKVSDLPMVFEREKQKFVNSYCDVGAGSTQEELERM